MSVLVVSAASAQAPPIPDEARDLDPALTGVWESTAVLAPGAVEWVQLEIDGNTLTQADRVIVDGEAQERRSTVECFLMDMPGPAGSEGEGAAIRDVISCPPSESGRTGYGGLGQYRIDGDTLTLGMPGPDGDWMPMAVFERAAP